MGGDEAEKRDGKRKEGEGEKGEREGGRLDMMSINQHTYDHQSLHTRAHTYTHDIITFNDIAHGPLLQNDWGQNSIRRTPLKKNLIKAFYPMPSFSMISIRGLPDARRPSPPLLVVEPPIQTAPLRIYGMQPPTGK